MLDRFCAENVVRAPQSPFLSTPAANGVRAGFGLRKINPVAAAEKPRRQRLPAAKKDDQPVNFTIFGCKRLTQPAG
jgi:hypothetical protein